MVSYETPTLAPENRTNLNEVVNTLEEKCNKCKPLTALTCVAECRTWKLKNQLRNMHEKISKPDFTENLLNTLKNQRRLKILDIMSRQSYSISKVQEKMSSLGYKHSQQTIMEEYVAPLIEAGLIAQGQNPYNLTLFGCRVNGLVKDFPDLEEILPPHSECYEEGALDSLLERPRTCQDMRKVIPVKSVGRVLSRLQKSTLVQTSKEKNYIFFFRTKRNALLERLSPTEDRVFQNIPDEGIYAAKLSTRSGISLRRTYKYVRKLKGKKLVFERRKPLIYSLTDRGVRVASMLKNLRNLVAETQDATKQFLKDKGTSVSSGLETHVAIKNEKTERVKQAIHLKQN
jgi:predicted transcriptional regulator